MPERRRRRICLDEGVYPDVWKRQSLVLLPKAGKPPGEIILNRLLKYTEGVNGLSSSSASGKGGRP